MSGFGYIIGVLEGDNSSFRNTRRDEAKRINNELAEHYNYDGQIEITGLPPLVNGATSPEIGFGPELRITGSNIQMGEKLLNEFFWRDEYLDTLHHELIHGKQFEEIANRDEHYSSAELMAMMPLKEGQTTYNLDQNVYPDSTQLYNELLENVEDDLEP